ncbi:MULTISPECIES: rhodanese-like domain-containing protein [Shewanella]|uniref:rhodanese-like domain-containing protein n=1 Tax=Shewanella TaxID=22 RepID=UPI0004905985|nr:MULTISPECIES: rhodanese-like domain-containing protein [Shewanella]QLE87126.1 rhodanese-like domain-containing protein [Shewanella sp. Scap07]
MKTKLSSIMFSLMFVAGIPNVFAGSGEPMGPATYHEIQLHTISMAEAESLLGQKDVLFFDVNTLELWAEGFIPGATFINVDNWQDLLPKEKDKVMVFYCANRLCNASEIAAREVMKLGYTNVRQMHDGIYGWRLSGRPTERP